MLIATSAVIAALVGALVFALADGKLSEAGKCLMLAGFIGIVLAMSGHTVRIG